MFLLVSCGSGSGSSAGASQASTSPTSSPSSNEPRIEGDYDFGNGFIVHFEPSCDSGPCDVTMSYDYSSQNGAKASGVLKFDGHSYDGIVNAVSGCLINNQYHPNTTQTALHYHLVGVPKGQDFAALLSGYRTGVSKLMAAGKGYPGCAAKLSREPVHANRQ